METTSATFATPGRTLLTLRVPAGAIAIETDDGSETSVELRVHGDDEAARELISRCRIELRERGADRSEVLVEVPKRRGLGSLLREPQVELRVRTPGGADVAIETRSADVEGRGRLGSVDIQAVSGDVRLEEVEERATIGSTSGDIRLDLAGGPVDVNTTSGDIELGGIHGHANVRSVSGDIRIRHAAESAQVTSVSGDQSLEGVVQGDVRLQSVSGDVTVGIRRGSRVWIDAKSISGDTASELELGDAPGDAGDDDAPLVELRVNTVSGDIRVVRAGAPVR